MGVNSQLKQYSFEPKGFAHFSPAEQPRKPWPRTGLLHFLVVHAITSFSTPLHLPFHVQSHKLSKESDYVTSFLKILEFPVAWRRMPGLFPVWNQHHCPIVISILTTAPLNPQLDGTSHLPWLGGALRGSMSFGTYILSTVTSKFTWNLRMPTSLD